MTARAKQSKASNSGTPLKMNEISKAAIEAKRLERKAKRLERKSKTGTPLKKKSKNNNKSILVNGKEVRVSKFFGFRVKTVDALRLRLLREEMIAKGIPREQIRETLKVERRKAERKLAREFKKVCLKCRKAGHLYSSCPAAGEEIVVGICYKCGSSEHKVSQCKESTDDLKYAKCFVCSKRGHISKQCPNNLGRLDPKGRASKEAV